MIQNHHEDASFGTNECRGEKPAHRFNESDLFTHVYFFPSNFRLRNPNFYFFSRSKLPVVITSHSLSFQLHHIYSTKACIRMYSRLRVLAIVGLVLASSMSSDARRRSRLDLPIQVSADAPLEDNLATASDSEVAVAKLEMPASSLAKEQPKEETNKKAAAETDEDSTHPAECNSDNINFELVTG